VSHRTVKAMSGERATAEPDKRCNECGRTDPADFFRRSSTHGFARVSVCMRCEQSRRTEQKQDGTISALLSVN
jgi:hypothetical protein